MMSEWMFEAGSATHSMLWDEPSSNIGPTAWHSNDDKGKQIEDWLQPLANEGSYPLSDVVVTGKRNTGQGYTGGDYDSSWFDWDGYDSEQPQSPPPPPPRPEDWRECLDRQIDDLAEIAANIINRLPDSDRKEYGFLIWMDGNGDVHLSTLIHGDNFSLTGLTTSTPSSLGFSSWSQVVGMVHSHPTLVHARTPDGSGLRYHEDGSPYYIDVPSESRFDLPSAGDWQWLDNTFSSGNQNVSMMRQYVLHDAILSEYDLYQNPITANPQDRRDNSVLATNENGNCDE